MIQAKERWFFAEGSVIVRLQFYASARGKGEDFGLVLHIVNLGEKNGLLQ
jgi:hypothetical protein